MNQLPDNFFTNVDFFISEHLFEHARRFLKKVPGFGKQDATIAFFLGVVDMLEGNRKEALHIFTDLVDHAVLAVPALACQICIHTRQDYPDRRVLEGLLKRMANEKSRMDSEAGNLTAWVYFQNEDYSQAASILEPFLSVGTGNTRIFSLAACIEMKNHGSTERAKTHLETAMKLNGPDVAEALILLLQWHLLQKDIESAELVLREITKSYDKLVPVVIVQLEVQMARQNWDTVESLADKALSQDPNAVLPSLYFAVSRICSKRSSLWKEFESTALIALDRLEKLEPRNPVLWVKYVRLFSAVGAGRLAILQKTLSLMQRAFTSNPDTFLCYMEYGRQLVLQMRFKEALDLFDKAAISSVYSLDALIGKIFCLIEMGFLDEAAKEINRMETLMLSLPEKQTNISKSIPRRIEVDVSKLLMNIAVKNQIGGAVKKDPVVLLSDVIQLLRSLENQMEQFVKDPLCLDLIANIDFFFVASVVDAALQFCPSEPHKIAYDSIVLDHCNNLLNILHSIVPGQVDIATLLARIRYLKSDVNGANGLIAQMMEAENFGSNSEVLLLDVEVALSQKASLKAKMSLDRAIANDFKLKESLRYHLLHSRFLSVSSEAEKAVSVLTDILERIGAGRFPSGSVQDYCRVYIELVNLLKETKKFSQAEIVLNKAMELFSGSIVAVPLIIAEVSFVLASDPASPKVIPLLLSIDPKLEDHYYVAQEILGRFYLTNQLIKEYVELHERLYVRMKETPSASRMLGEAYMRLPNPKKAIEVIQKATREQPHNQMLESAMGSFYIRCHMYKNALNYYEAVVKRGNLALRLEFAELLIKLARYERAEHLLNEIASDKSEVFTDSLLASRSLKLLASLQLITQNEVERLAALQSAKLSYEKNLIRARRENPDAVPEITREFIEILFLLADSARDIRNFPSAVQLLEQARAIARDDLLVVTLEKLAKLLLLSGDVGDSFRVVKELQKVDSSNKSAKFLLAYSAFHRKDFDHALDALKEYFNKYPNDWPALSEAIPIMVRMGQIRNVERILNEMEENAGPEIKIARDFCFGLFHRYSGNASQAIQLIAPALNLSAFNYQAGKALIEIICNWDREIIGSQYLQCNTQMNFVDLDSTCQSIMKEIIPNNEHPSANVDFLQKLPILSCGDAARLTDMLKVIELRETNKLQSPVKSYILVTILLRQNMKDRAVEILKQYDKYPWNIEDSEFLEKMWLLRAEHLNMSNGGDEANLMIFKASEFNRSSYWVNLFEGTNSAQNQLNFSKAAECFRKAFDSSGNQDFVSGERCAWAMIKANRPMEAVAVLNYFRAPNSSPSPLARELSAELWNVILSLRQQALSALAFKSDDEKDDTRNRARKSSKALQ